MSPPTPYDAKGCNFKPNFNLDCHKCGDRPTVIVIGHIVPQTGLCGVCFFADRTMSDWDLWNDDQEGTE